MTSNCHYGQVLDHCVQLFGGHGYMNEQRVARARKDARVTKAWAGSNETVKELIGRGPGLVTGGVEMRRQDATQCLHGALTLGGGV